jgi:2-amino-4-hydroxy-6-hydroxymethyldihydropteridine diphosphokinase
MNIVYLALGSNLGDKEKNISKAYELISLIGKILLKSELYYSKAKGFDSENDFVNSVIKIETKLNPIELLNEIQAIERNMGRLKKSMLQKYEDRIIDIDILYFNKENVNYDFLTIPHPMINLRDFVLEPLKNLKEQGDKYLL